MLNTVTFPAETPSDLPPILIVHGLYGSARNWGGIARGLAKSRTVLTVDQRNHGDSPHLPTQSYPDMAADLAEVIRANGGLVDLLGHSMGGKAAMQLALTDGGLVRRLIVADIAPVAYGHDQSHHARTMRALDLTGLTSRGEADRRLAATLDDPGLRAFFLQSLDLKAGRWKLNLDVLEAEMPKLVGWPETEGRWDGPALFLSGSKSDYVLPEHREKIRHLFPDARFAKIPGAGHWLHADNPRAFEETVRIFFNS